MTSYSLYLEAKGFSQNTVDSYMYAVSQFEQRVSRIDDRALLEHKEWLMASFSARTANARIAALNAYLDFVGYKGLRLKGVRIQQKPYLETWSATRNIVLSSKASAKTKTFSGSC